jgi:hypothetical protein
LGPSRGLSSSRNLEVPAISWLQAMSDKSQRLADLVVTIPQMLFGKLLRAKLVADLL